METPPTHTHIKAVFDVGRGVARLPGAGGMGYKHKYQAHTVTDWMCGVCWRHLEATLFIRDTRCNKYNSLQSDSNTDTSVMKWLSPFSASVSHFYLLTHRRTYLLFNSYFNSCGLGPGSSSQTNRVLCCSLLIIDGDAELVSCSPHGFQSDHILPASQNRTTGLIQSELVMLMTVYVH